MKLSIIIPYYNVKPYTDMLLDCLAPQITDDVEVILIDDGSDIPFETDYKWCQVYRQKNGGASSARNTGLNLAKGEYITFIDSDDLVADDYVKQILAKTPFDYLDMSWKSLAGEGAQFFAKLNTPNDKLNNPSAVTRAWNRAFIGDVRFNENKQVAEDAEFTHTLIPRAKRRAVVTDYLYFYRTSTPNSLTKRFVNGQTDTKRIVYYYNRVSKDMTGLLEEIKEEYKNHEVYLLTNKCEIPEIYNYAVVERPHSIRGSELRGEPFKEFTQFERPIETQVVIYTTRIEKVSGLTTFIVNFCQIMSKYYDIMVIYSDDINADRLRQLRKYVDTRKNNGLISCNTLIVNSIYDKVPTNIIYKKKLQMCHTCKMPTNNVLPTDNDDVVFVSDTACSTWGRKKATVIHNMLSYEESNDMLMLVSCMRDGHEKGVQRLIDLANLFKSRGIKFMWLLFTSSNIHGLVDGMIQMPTVLDTVPYMGKADYVVQLSDIEAYPYVLLEALYRAHTPIITTPLEVLDEIGFKDGIHGYIVPFDISSVPDETIDRIVEEIPNREVSELYLSSDADIKKWRKVLGNTKPNHTYDPTAFKTVRVIEGYTDMALNKFLKVGEIHEMPLYRVQIVVDAGYCEIVE